MSVTDPSVMWSTAFQKYGTVLNASQFGASPKITNNDVPINNGLQALLGLGGGTLIVDPGIYQTSSNIIIPGDNITLQGSGWSTVFQPLANVNTDVISTPLPPASGTPGYTINYMVLKDFAIDMSLVYNASGGTIQGLGNGIHTYGARYSFIQHIFIKRSPNWAISMDGDNPTNFSYDIRIEDCIFDLCNANVYGSTAEACWIWNCEFKWCGSATNAPQPLFQSPDTVAQHLRMKSGYQTITSNIFGNGGTYTTEAILVSNSGPCKIIGNRFDQVRYHVIKLQGGNHIFAFNQLGSPSKIGNVNAVQIGSNNNQIIGNKWDTTAGATNQLWAIAESGGPFTGNIIADNFLIPGTSGTILTTAGSTHVLHHNVGYHDEMPGAAISKVNTTYQVVDTDSVVMTDSTSAAFTVTLPNARTGYLLTIKDYTGTAATHNITLNTLSGATIDTGASGTVKLTTNFQALRLISDGTNWFLI